MAVERWYDFPEWGYLVHVDLDVTGNIALPNSYLLPTHIGVVSDVVRQKNNELRKSMNSENKPCGHVSMLSGVAVDEGWIRVRRAGSSFTQDGQASFFKGYTLGSGSEEQGPDGVYVRWHWDGQRLEVQTCETGFLPVFIYFDKQQAVVATRLSDLFQAAQIPPSIDHVALSVFLRLGFFIGDRTPFKYVHVLGPNGQFVWSSEVQKLEWKYPEISRSPLSRQDALEAYRDIFRSSMDQICDHLGANFAVPLSGGRDSRHIALELHRRGVIPKFALTAQHLPPRPNEDTVIARVICDHMGWQHIVVRQPKNQFRSEAEHAELTDLLSFEHSWTVPIKRELDRRGITQVFDGVGGDVLSAALFQYDEPVSLYENGDTQDLADYVIDFWKGLGGEIGILETCGSELAEISNRETARAHLKEELDLHLDQPSPLKSFYFWNRSRRGTGLLPFKILSSFTSFSPYISRDIRYFLLSLSHHVTADQMFHTNAISLADPIVGSIPYEDKDDTRTSYSRLRTRLFALSLSIACVSERHNRLWKPSFIFPRCVKSIITGGFEDINWWNPRRTVYLGKMGEFCDEMDRTANLHCNKSASQEDFD